ncbi:MAG: hypothetical protein IKS23_04505, partial [Alphaproteobacteria bacterium]|nr:hypothetical protein [Alphaproteobacteria bacterium]
LYKTPESVAANQADEKKETIYNEDLQYYNETYYYTQESIASDEPDYKREGWFDEQKGTWNTKYYETSESISSGTADYIEVYHDENGQSERFDSQGRINGIQGMGIEYNEEGQMKRLIGPCYY